MELTDEIRWGDVWIARREDAVTAYLLDPQRLGEAAPIVDSKSVKVTDYGNAATTLRVTVQRKHASPAAARQFITQHAKEIASKDPVTSRALVTTYYGESASTETIPAAVPTALPGEQIGSTTIHHYTFIGEAIV